MRYFLTFIISIIILLAACEKEPYQQGSILLKFSADTVSFDTVFTSTSTATLRLLVYNTYKKPLKISSVKLAEGDQSPFFVNVNGQVGPKATDITIDANDSMYIFIRASAPPSGTDLPLFVKDSLVFTTNGNTQDVKLIAFAQDVQLFRDSTIKSQTWHGPKPYLIFGNLTIDSAETLSIDTGVVVYLHKLANIYVKGTVIANGEFKSQIQFRHDRLEQDYNDIPGQWGGIYFSPGSKGNKLTWVSIKNGTTGIQLGKAGNETGCDLELSNVIISEMSYAGLIAYHSTVKASNCLLVDAADYLCGFEGGTYQFYHSTLANYYGDREIGLATLVISNYRLDANQAGNAIPEPITQSFFRNCIIYGNFNDELELDFKSGIGAECEFDYCIIRSNKYKTATDRFSDIIWNKDPKFVSTENLNFELDTLSPAKDAANKDWGLLYPYDLKNVSRVSDSAPDIGAYERIEKQ